MNNYLVTVNVKGIGDYELELMSRNPDSAAKRAVFTLWAGRHRNLALDDFTVVETKVLV